jgi:hypothetical protein
MTINRTSPATRRSVLGALTASAASLPVIASAPASAAPDSYIPRAYPSVYPLSTADRHLVGRFCYGITRRTVKQVRDAGGGRAWFEQQLEPGAIWDDPALEVAGWWPSLDYEPSRLWERHKARTEAGWDWMQNYQRARLNRRIRTRRQLLEVMTEFWENHLNVPAIGEPHFTFRRDYGSTIRSHAFGNYADMLYAAITHPAMLIYLDNAISTAKNMNENLGRELLELHTVGLATGYTENEVKDSARILTGWRVDVFKSWDTSYRPADHWVGPVRVLGFAEDNDVPDGRELTRRYLTYLAHHPATAQRIARKLVVKFIGDSPSPELVDRLAEIYLNSGTEIVPVLRALITSAEFADSVGAKVRDPADDLVATYRLLKVKVDAPNLGSPVSGTYAANAMLWQAGAMGLMPYQWPRPDGPPLTNRSWSTPSRIMSTFQVHRNVSGGYFPERGVTYRELSDWIPEMPISFDLLVDYLSVKLLQRRANRAILQACCEAVNCRPTESITGSHRLVTWDMPKLLTTFLDSPYHMNR